MKRDSGDMIGLDLYLASLPDRQQADVARNVKQVNRLPLMSWDLAGIGKDVHPDKIALASMRARFGWKTRFNTVSASDFEAIVVTDDKQVILWASEGFKTMTGYDASYAIGKTPKFLQGANTSEDTRARIRRKIKSGRSFTERLINYRENGEEYLCEVKVIPLRDTQNQLTHFIAFERAV